MDISKDELREAASGQVAIAIVLKKFDDDEMHTAEEFAESVGNTKDGKNPNHTLHPDIESRVWSQHCRTKARPPR